jgi:hypothetical protein
MMPYLALSSGTGYMLAGFCRSNSRGRMTEPLSGLPRGMRGFGFRSNRCPGNCKSSGVGSAAEVSSPTIPRIDREPPLEGLHQALSIVTGRG